MNGNILSSTDLDLTDGLYNFGLDYWYLFLGGGSVLFFLLGILVVMMIARKDRTSARGGMSAAVTGNVEGTVEARGEEEES
jgi:hypothetical protein